MLSISDIGKTRLEKVLFKDKAQHPSKVCEVLKYDLKNIVDNYAELDGEIIVTMDTDNNGFNFNISFSASRLKSFGSLPQYL